MGIKDVRFYGRVGWFSGFERFYSEFLGINSCVRFLDLFWFLYFFFR